MNLQTPHLLHDARCSHPINKGCNINLQADCLPTWAVTDRCPSVHQRGLIISATTGNAATGLYSFTLTPRTQAKAVTHGTLVPKTLHRLWFCCHQSLNAFNGMQSVVKNRATHHTPSCAAAAAAAAAHQRYVSCAKMAICKSTDASKLPQTPIHPTRPSQQLAPGSDRMPQQVFLHPGLELSTCWKNPHSSSSQHQSLLHNLRTASTWLLCIHRPESHHHTKPTSAAQT